MELATISQMGATLLLPLQIGPMSHAELYEAGKDAAGVALTPAMPMRKAVTTATALVEFVQQVQPRHVHLLGIGLDNRRAAKLIRVIQHYCPGTLISMDSNRLRAKAGRGRPLTESEKELRAAPTERVYGAVNSTVLALSGEALDYTDLIASPSLWADEPKLLRIAEAVGMVGHQANAFVDDPDSFLQSPLSNQDQVIWIEHPLMELELDQAWEQYVDQIVRSRVRTAAIVSVFRDSALRRKCA